MKTVLEIYEGSDGAATKELYDELTKLGSIGVVALNLFRACKASHRAKVYRRKWKGEAYGKKNWSLSNLCEALIKLEGLPANARKLPTESIDYWRRWERSNQKLRKFFVSDRPFQEPPAFATTWGWKEDAAQEYHKWVLYVDLPTGQVSFHAASPLSEHRYAGEWDGQHCSARRITAYVDHVLNGTPAQLILQPCAKCGAPIPLGVRSDLCPPCAIQPASENDLNNLKQASFAL